MRPRPTLSHSKVPAPSLLHRSMSLFTERRNCEATFELITQGVGCLDEVRNESSRGISAARRRVRTHGELQARKRKGHMEPDGCTMARLRETGRRRRLRDHAIPN